jgi:hypothetical protein
MDNIQEEFRGYLGNTSIKRSNVPVNWTEERVKEYVKCAEDPLYFCEKYIKVVHVDRGFVPLEMYNYQKEILDKITNNRRVVVVTSRQAGKCVFINTSIRVRNKITGEVIETTIGDFYEMQKKHDKNDNKKER